MLTDTQLAKLIVNWKAQIGEEVRGRTVVSYDSSLRVPMYRDLLETLIKEHQYDESDLLAFGTQKIILDASYNPNSEKKNILRELAQADWQRVVAERYPMKILSHDPSSIDTSRVREIPPEPTPEELGPLVLQQEEFDEIVMVMTKQFDKEFLVDMLVTHEKEITPKQASRLKKIKIKAANLQRIKNMQPEMLAKAEEDKENIEAAEMQENPIDRSIFKDLPPVVDPIDEDFAKKLAAMRRRHE